MKTATFSYKSYHHVQQEKKGGWVFCLKGREINLLF